MSLFKPPKIGFGLSLRVLAQTRYVTSGSLVHSIASLLNTVNFHVGGQMGASCQKKCQDFFHARLMSQTQ